MKLFVSWSKERSQKIAEILCKYFPIIIQEIDTFFSPDDISKGSRWLSELSGTLNDYSMGILCITPESLGSHWLYFEAGALSKSLDTSKVIPVLFDVESSDLPAPLAQFQSCKFSRVEIYKLVKDLNRFCTNPRKDDELSTTFDLVWPKIEKSISDIIAQPQTEVSKTPNDSDKISEILNTVRAISKGTLKRIHIKEKNWSKNEVEQLTKSLGIIFDNLNFSSMTLSDKVSTKNVLDLLYSKISKAGFPNTGRPISNLGDSILDQEKL